MIRTGKRLFAILMALCLVAALLPTAALASAPSGITASVSGGAQAGKQITEITVTITEGTFTSTSLETQFTVNAEAVGGSSSETVTAASGGGSTEAKLTVDFTPTKAGSITVTAKKEAFESEQPEGELSNTISVTAAEAPTSVTASSSSLTLGQSGTITLTIASNNSNAFISSPGTELFTVSGATVSSAGTGNGTTTELTVTPTSQTITISVQPGAFKYQPESAVTATVSSLSVSKPSGTVSAKLEGGTLTAGTAVSGQKITLTATDTLIFKADPKSAITLSGAGASGLDFTASGSDKTATLTLSGTPSKAGSITIAVGKGAFQYEPEAESITATGDGITVSAPTVSAVVSGSGLTVGTAGTITVKATGSKFAAGLEGHLDYFTLSGGGVTQPSAVSATGDTATLTVTPTTASPISVTTIKKDAFDPQPAGEVTGGSITGTVTVSAPTVTVTATGNLTLGQSGTISLTAAGSVFADSLSADQFTVTGATVSAVGTGGKDTTTLTVTPSEKTITIKVAKAAFKYQPTDETVTATVNVTVNDPTPVAPTVTLSTGTALTAGDKDPVVSLTAAGAPFAGSVASGNVTLSGDAATGLTVSGVKAEGSALTVTLSGTVAVAGTITVTVAKEAFEPQAAADASVDVKVDKAPITVETESGSSGSIATSDDALAAAVLTPEEQALYAKGAKVVVELEEKDITASVPAAEKTAVVAAAPGYTAGAFLDVSLFKQINGGTKTAVSSTNGNIRVVLPIPAGIQAADREYAVVRIHNGTATLLTTVASTASSITVETDRFSTYAIVYRAKAAATATPAPSATATAAPSATAAPKSPATGDGAEPVLWTAMLAVCLTGLTVVMLRRKKSGR